MKKKTKMAVAAITCPLWAIPACYFALYLAATERDVETFFKGKVA